MKIGIYHGYELTGSGSNEYTRYLARSLAAIGHEIHLICREDKPEKIPFITQMYSWDHNGQCTHLFTRKNQKTSCILHLLPHASVRPVFLTDKQRTGCVKSFISLSDAELAEYHAICEKLLICVLTRYPVDILHANHLIYQPVAALKACKETNIPLIIYPHGSSIEYTVKKDDRFAQAARKALEGCAGIITGNREVRDRIFELFPKLYEMLFAKTHIVGVGVDTSLFAPIKKTDRLSSIKHLAYAGSEGKKPEQSEELKKQLSEGNVDAVKNYFENYDHSKPDTDLNDHLKKIPWNKNILLFVGALTVGKGVQSLIAAMPFILKNHPDTHLVIIGAGAYREVLEALVFTISTGNKEVLLALCAQGNDLDRNEQTGPWEDVLYFFNTADSLSFILENGKNLENHVHFLGRLDHDLLKYLFPCADLAVFPSIVPEAYPLVLMESLANGVMPVVTYFSGFKDGVDELGFALGKETAEKMKISAAVEERIPSIIKNISALLDSKKSSKQTAEFRKIAVERYDWSIRADQMVQAYKTFINK